MESSKGKKVLLSGVCQPFGTKYGDGFGVSYEGSHQIMWAQGIFRTRATTMQWGIDFIAVNLKTPTVTLHYPTMEQFIEEIKKGYDYIGIAFVLTTMHKMKPMVKAIREHAPQSKIVLGGYGTSLGEPLKELADYVCKGEGVEYMRRLLGEPVDVPFVQPDITQTQSLFSIPIPGEVGYVFVGLGCPNGCDFCATSHYFDKKHIKFLPTGQSIVDSFHKMRVKHPKMVDFWINDEDLLLNKERGHQFLHAMRKSDLPPLALTALSSVKALSQYPISELVEMGIDWIWVGFEGMRAGFDKMKGRSYRDLFEDLRYHGISILASMIIGFDYQTPEIIEEEFEELMSLGPTATQFLIYGTPHGTPSYKRMQDQGRILSKNYENFRLHDGFTLTFKHPNISPEEMSAIQRDLFHKEFERLGPTIFRVPEGWLRGYENLRDHPAPRVRAKAEKYGKDAHRMLMTMPGAKKYLNPTVVDHLNQFESRLIEQTGPMTMKERLGAKLIPAAMAYTKYKVDNDVGQQPTYARRTFRMPKQSQKSPSFALWPRSATKTR